MNLRFRKLFAVAPAALSEVSTRIKDIRNIPTVMASSVDIQSISPRGDLVPGVYCNYDVTGAELG